MTILGVDVSHHQGVINWSQVKASGRDFCVLKATEGVGYTDPTLATNRAAAHAAGLIVGLYHFCRLGPPATEAAYFAKVVGPLQPGEFVVLDYEPNPVPPGSAAWSKQWLDATRAALGVAPLVYMNTYTMNFDNWSTVARDYGLWLAKYDNSTVASPTQWWPTEAMKQDNDKSLVVGILGGVDDDVFYGTTQQLLAYGCQGGDDLTAQFEADVRADLANKQKQLDTLTVWQEDVLRRVQSIHLYGFQALPADPAKQAPPSWRQGGDLGWLDKRQEDMVASIVAQSTSQDPAALAEAVVAAMGAEFAQKVIDALGQRINATQPPSA